MNATALLLLCVLTFGGCGAIGEAVMMTGLTISCGPIPLSADQCNGGWLKTLVKPSSSEGVGSGVFCDPSELRTAKHAWLAPSPYALVQERDLAWLRWYRVAEACGVEWRGVTAEEG